MMSECGELPFLDGDIMMSDHTFTNESTCFSSTKPTGGCSDSLLDMEWNSDTIQLGCEDTELFPGSAMLLDGSDADILGELFDGRSNFEDDLNSLLQQTNHTSSAINCNSSVPTSSSSDQLHGHQTQQQQQQLQQYGSEALLSSNNTSFDGHIPAISIDDLISPKEELTTSSPPTLDQTPLDVALSSIDGHGLSLGGPADVVPDSLLNCKLSPTYSYAGSAESWDSGVSDASSPTTVGSLDQQLSPSTSPTPDYLASYSSGYCSSSSSPTSSSSPCSSPSSSPNSSPPAAPPTFSVVAADRLQQGGGSSPSSAVTTTATVLRSTTTNSNPQFYIERRANLNNKFTISTSSSNNGLKRSINCLSSNNSNSNKQQLPIAYVQAFTTTTGGATTTTTSARVLPATRILSATSGPATTTSSKPSGPTTTTINKSLFTTRVGGAGTKFIHNTSSSSSAGSASPSVVTLSGVNKTAGIIKSPSVLSTSRNKVVGLVHSNTLIHATNSNTSSSNSITTINSSGIQQQLQQQAKPIAVISKSEQLVGIANSVFTLADGQQIFVQKAPNGKLVSCKPTAIRDQVGNIRIIRNGSSSGGGGTPVHIVRNSSVLSAGNRLIRHNVMNTSSSSGVQRSTSSSSGGGGGSSASGGLTYRSMCLPAGKLPIKESLSSLVAIPKEETIDSDDDIELPKNNQPIVLTDEEKKLALKEGIKFPSHFPLSRSQERDLKRIRRKIRNKVSAQDSRKRKKEYMDQLEENIRAKSEESAHLKLQVASLEEKNKKLAEQLKRFQLLMDAQPAPSLAYTSSSCGAGSTSHTNNGHNNSSSSGSRQQHQSTFIMMMILSVALFVYPSVLPQGKTGTDLLTAVAHRMPPAGNTRSLLEAATAKLSACQDDNSNSLDDELDLDTKPTIAALTDHDYTPPSKRARYSALRDDTSHHYCMPSIDDHLPLRPSSNKEAPSGGGDAWRGGRDGGSGPPLLPPDDPAKPNKSVVVVDDGPVSDEIPLIKLDPDMEKFPQGVLESVISQFEMNHNWTENVLKNPLDSVSQSVVVELAARGTKRFREDIELE